MIRVFVADDNREFSDLLVEYLEQQPDIEVVGIAYNGKDTLELVSEEPPDILLLDIIMPHLDGLGVLEQLNHLPEKPKVIMLTAFGQEDITGKQWSWGRLTIFSSRLIWKYLWTEYAYWVTVSFPRRL